MELVPRDVIARAVGLAGPTRAFGRLGGPALAAVLYAWQGTGLVFAANAASYFANGLKGRAQEEKWDDHLVIDKFYELDVAADGKLDRWAIPMRTAMNEVLRDWYVGDC